MRWAQLAVADLRCDVWVAAGLDGWPIKEPCSIVPKLLVDVEEEA